MPAENFDFAEHMAVGDIYPNVLGLNYSVFAADSSSSSPKVVCSLLLPVIKLENYLLIAT